MGKRLMLKQAKNFTYLEANFSLRGRDVGKMNLQDV